MGNISREPAGSIFSAVHPHTCGEHVDKVSRTILLTGSSPHVWGTSARPGSHIIAGRFIPTRVGNIITRRADFSGVAVHPHTCGEHLRPRKRRSKIVGSSPHVWGTFIPKQILNNNRRFIPTRVGNILCNSTIISSRTVHPHTCGEHSSASCQSFLARGSSPHVWGTCICFGPFILPSRFIPTRVGNI